MNGEETLAAIEVRGLKKAFGAVQALDGLSFSVEKGELFFLLGPSGCGKTTLLRILAGLERPDEGQVLFSGQDVAAFPPHQRGAPMVFQNYALWPHLSVGENVAFGLRERKVGREEAQRRTGEALAAVGLEGLGPRRPGQLSGGQQQRVALARALVVSPSLVLLDEPLSNLDAKLRQEMREEIERLHRQTGLTMVYVTHDQVEALSMATRVAVLSAGRLMALGPPKELYHRPPNLFCARFLGEANLIAGKLVGRDGRRGRVETAWGIWEGFFSGEDGTGVSPAAPSVQVMIRPENLRLGAPPSPANRLEAQVLEGRMTGGTYGVRLSAQGVPLRATLLNRPTLDLPLDRPVSWHVLPEETVILESAEGGEGGEGREKG
jgi:iron(III) transport system ATP-binding protein